MSGIATAIVGAAVIGGVASSSAAGKAAKAQRQAADQAAQLEREQYYDQVNRQEPFRQAGLKTTDELMRQFGLGGDAASAGYGNMLRDFTMADYQADPGYAFRMSEGLKGLDRQAAARGGLISGAALKAASDFSGKQASAEYSNAYNRYNQNRSQRYQMLTGQQTAGANATNAQNAASANYANAAGDAYMQAGNARASGYVGQGNAMSQAAGNIGNYFAQQQMLNRLNPYASPAQGAAIQSGWNAWKDPMLGG